MTELIVSWNNRVNIKTLGRLEMILKKQLNTFLLSIGSRKLTHLYAEVYLM